MAISIQQARELLGPIADGKSDEEVAGLLERAYAWAGQIIGAYKVRRATEQT